MTGKKSLRELVEREMEAQEENQDDIQQIVIGPAWSYGSEGDDLEVVSIDDLEDYTGNTGYGSQSFPAIYVWTDNRLYLKRHYDGSESIVSVPRDPTTDELPKPVGGG